MHRNWLKILEGGLGPSAKKWYQFHLKVNNRSEKSKTNFCLCYSACFSFHLCWYFVLRIHCTRRDLWFSKTTGSCVLYDDSHEASERTQQWREPRARGREIVLCQIFCRSHFIVCVSWLVELPLPREILNIILWLCIVGGRVTVMARYVKHIDSLY